VADYFKTKAGYMVHKNDPKRYEHRDVWEKYWARKIPAGFHVHHKNKVRHDNRPENLECIEASKHLKMHGLTFEMVNHINKVRALDEARLVECAWCGDDFSTTSRVKRFCCAEHRTLATNMWNDTIRSEARAKLRGEGDCPHCGKHFKRDNPGGKPERIYCTRSCMRNAMYLRNHGNKAAA
jgi:hypothetical protein